MQIVQIALAAGLSTLVAAQPTTERANALRAHVEELITNLRDGDVEVRSQACEELARLSTPAALPLVERYLRARFDECLDSWLVGEVLVAMGPGAERAVERLIDEAEREDNATYEWALRLLAEVGPWHSRLRERLSALAEPSAAMSGLTGMGTVDLDWALLRARLRIDPNAATDDLVAICKRADALELEFVARLLTTRGAAASAAVPWLLRAFTSDKHQVQIGDTLHVRYLLVRRVVADALVTIAPRDPHTIPAHLARLSRTYPKGLRLVAARAIAAMGPTAADAVIGLVGFRDGWDDDDVMREVVVALGEIGPAAAPATTMLEELVRDVHFDDELVAAAQVALGRIRNR